MVVAVVVVVPWGAAETLSCVLVPAALPWMEVVEHLVAVVVARLVVVAVVGWGGLSRMDATPRGAVAS